MSEKIKMITIELDGKQVKVPSGNNLIEAVRIHGIEIPHYCYHPKLKIVGNCRMCQVEIEGMEEMQIACNTIVEEGMIVRTHLSSECVRDAQRAILEFILLNHPLDCTVCDRAGHCKLQDYYFEYNTRASRFEFEKINKPKAVPLGPEIVYDAERCIMCTRCIRFTDEVSCTGELYIHNRGDKAMINTAPGVLLDNPIAGNVVDLCPVGALTHRRWRFKSRIWYAKNIDTLCLDSSDGCNIRVAMRDGQVVIVKSRQNVDTDLYWISDESRYGVERFFADSIVKAKDHPMEKDLAEFGKILKGAGGDVAIILSPFLSLEEMWILSEFSKRVVCSDLTNVVVPYRQRKVDKIVSKIANLDYAPNARAAELLEFVKVSSDWQKDIEETWKAFLSQIEEGRFCFYLFVGDAAILRSECSNALKRSVANAEMSLGFSSSSSSTKFGDDFVCGVPEIAKDLILIPGIAERSGLYLNSNFRLQRSIELRKSFRDPLWVIFDQIAAGANEKLCRVKEGRDLSRILLKELWPDGQVSLSKIGKSGMDVRDYF